MRACRAPRLRKFFFQSLLHPLCWPFLQPAGCREHTGELLHPHQLQVLFPLGNQADEAAYLRIDELAELASAEDAVMADAFRQQMLALVCGDAAAEGVCSFGLAV